MGRKARKNSHDLRREQAAESGTEIEIRPTGVPADLPPVPMPITLSDLPESEMEVLLTRVLQKVMDSDVQRKITEQIHAEFEKIAVEDVSKIAHEVLGRDYWEVMQITQSIRHGEVDSPYIVDQCLMALSGYYTPINVAAGILWSQYKERHSEIVVDLTDRRNYAHNRASSRADVMCAPLHRNASIMERLREGMMESINVLKKVAEHMWEEHRMVTKLQPDAAPGVKVLNSDEYRPWRRQRAS
jgi:hypothetical protein